MSYFSVANNTNAAAANYGLQSSNKALSKVYQQLSTGLAVNSPADNPAAYAQATQEQTQVASYDAAQSNIQDAANAGNVASDALASITDNLSQISTLAISATNSLNSPSDNAAIQGQVNQLVDQINSTASNTNFNGQPLLDGTLSNGSVQTGTAEGDQTALSIPNSSANALGVGNLDVTSWSATQNVATGTTTVTSPIQTSVDSAITSVLTTQATLGASLVSLDYQAQNNAVTQVNLEASQSSISDLNVAQGITSADEASTQNKFGIAVLSQANADQTSLLKLVTGQ